MARTFHRQKRLSALSEINVTPLIDLAFALLIIFMITAPLLEQSIDLDLPIESADLMSGLDQDRHQSISLNAQGVIFWSEEIVDELQLKTRLRELGKNPLPPTIHLRADRNLPYQRVITVIDLIKENRLTRISLDTEVE